MRRKKPQPSALSKKQMSIITAAQNGNYSAPSTWTGGIVPDNGDEARLNGFTVVMDLATIPASGTLAALNAKNGAGAATAGKLTIDLSDGLVGNRTINATAILSGTVPFIVTSYATYSLTINGNLTGGSATSATCVTTAATTTLIINGSVSGGSASASSGVSAPNSAVTINNGTVTGGALANGVSITTGTSTLNNCTISGGSSSLATVGLMATTGTHTLNGCNLVYSAGQEPVRGAVVYNPTASNYVQLSTTSGTVKLYPYRGVPVFGGRSARRA
jgi:hypothetical protein